MLITLEQLKKDYNKTLARFYKAEEYINSATDEQIKKWLPEFEKIIISLSEMMLDYFVLTGEEMTTEQTLKGFWNN